MNHRPALRRRYGRLHVDLMHFVQLHQRIFGKVLMWPVRRICSLGD